MPTFQVIDTANGQDNFYEGMVKDAANWATLEALIPVGTTATQTLTNKTLTAPTITGATITTSTVNGITPASGTNTFSLTVGSASLDVATAKTVNIDDDVTVSAELHVEAATHVNQDLTSDAGPTFNHVHANLTGNVTGNVTGDITGNLTGNVTGNTSGSSGSCTGNSATATSAAACSGNTAGSSGSCTGNAATATTAAACSGNTAGSSGSCTGNAATSTNCTGNSATVTNLTVESTSVVNQDLTTDASPAFVTAKLSGLTDTYVPVHTSDAVGLANSAIRSTSSAVGIGVAAGATSVLQVQSAADANMLQIYQTKNDGGSSNMVNVLDDRGFNGANTGNVIYATAYISGGNDSGNLLSLNTNGGGADASAFVVTMAGNAYVAGECSALSFNDRTPFYEGDALAEIEAIRGKDGKIDHATLPDFAKVEKVGGEKERDLGAMISILTVAVQQLLERVKKLEA
jgi:hypothetical protein